MRGGRKRSLGVEGLKDGDITEAAPPNNEPVATEWRERV